MKCFIENIVTDKQLASDINELVPDAMLRRRMSKIQKTAVMTAAECAGNLEGIQRLDAIITATGFGCLADSERFLRNMIANNEQLLNPTPFIQSTFNTVGGIVAMLCHNHCYNITYANRSHSFEDAVLDALMRIADNDSSRILIGAFDEQTQSQHKIMERMGILQKETCLEGAVFATLTAEPSQSSLAELSHWEVLPQAISESECMKMYSGNSNAILLTNSINDMGLFPMASAQLFADGVYEITNGTAQVILYNMHGGSRPTIMILKCIGY